MKCLLVDDEPGIREGLAALLRRKGHDVLTAADCAAAGDALAAQPFDVVISDWRLPDGLAATFLEACPCPVVAVSGHPEEVELRRANCQVMAKPVRPAQLIAAIEAICAVAAPLADENVAAASLPVDVQHVVDDLLRQLPQGTPVQMLDDGTFVRITFELPREHVPRPVPIGGDARWTNCDRGRRLELTLCRDGRPDAGLMVVRAGDEWPVVAELAVDFHGSDPSPSALHACLDSARAARAVGRVVHFLNVPPALRSSVAGQGRAHDMPMKGTVGPRLSAELADLWSQP